MSAVTAANRPGLEAPDAGEGIVAGAGRPAGQPVVATANKIAARSSGGKGDLMVDLDCHVTTSHGRQPARREAEGTDIAMFFVRKQLLWGLCR